MNKERGLERCLERLQSELEVVKASQLEPPAAQLEDSLPFSRIQVHQPKLGLYRKTRNSFLRFLAWARRLRQMYKSPERVDHS